MAIKRNAVVFLAALLFPFFSNSCGWGGGGSSGTTNITLSGYVDAQTTSPTGVATIRVQGAAVHVVNFAGQEVATATTDLNGRYSAAVPNLTGYGVTIDVPVSPKPSQRSGATSARMKGVARVRYADYALNINPGSTAVAAVLENLYKITIGDSSVPVGTKLDAIDVNKTSAAVYLTGGFGALAARVESDVAANTDPFSDSSITGSGGLAQTAANELVPVPRTTTVSSTGTATSTTTSTSTSTGSSTGTSSSTSVTTSTGTATSTSTDPTTGDTVVTVAVTVSVNVAVSVNVTTATGTGTSLLLGKFVAATCGTTDTCMKVTSFNSGTGAWTEYHTGMGGITTPCDAGFNWLLTGTMPSGVRFSLTETTDACPNPNLNVPQAISATFSGAAVAFTDSQGVVTNATRLGGDPAAAGTWKNFSCAPASNCALTTTIYADGTFARDSIDTNYLPCQQSGVWYAYGTTLWTALTSNSCLGLTSNSCVSGGQFGLPTADSGTYALSGNTLTTTSPCGVVVATKQ
ncbi:MAG: hypothetical protein HY098_06225 [Nitrospinae bacterium]|nr:hypothetical protein [Nitrospinota bacterium]